MKTANENAGKYEFKNPVKKFSASKMKSGDHIKAKGHGPGKCIGWVGNPPTLIRVEFDSGDVRDFHPLYLQEIAR